MYWIAQPGNQLSVCDRPCLCATLTPQTVLDAGQIAAFIKCLGAGLPLDAITIVKGVVVEDVGVLEKLSKSVLWHADLGLEQSRECYAYAQMAHVPLSST